MILRIIVIALAVFAAFVVGSLQGWDRAMTACDRMAKMKQETILGMIGASIVIKPIRIGTPVWWVHLLSLGWLTAGAVLIYYNHAEMAAMAMLATLTTALPTILHLHIFVSRLNAKDAPEGGARPH